MVGINFLFMFTLSGGCERSCISDIRACLDTHHICNRNVSTTTNGQELLNRKFSPLHFCLIIPVIIGLHLCSFGKQMASQMLCNFTEKLCYVMWIASPITELLPNQRQ